MSLSTALSQRMRAAVVASAEAATTTTPPTRCCHTITAAAARRFQPPPRCGPFLPPRHRRYTSSTQSPLPQKSSNSSSSSSSGGGGGGFFSNLRWQAAQALTSALPEEERAQLFKRLKLPMEKEEEEEEDDDDDDTKAVARHNATETQGKSIAEAVAAARAAEAQKFEQQRAQDAQKWQAEAQQAAERAVEAALRTQQARQTAFETWQTTVYKEREKKKNAGNVVHVDSTTTTSSSSSSSSSSSGATKKEEEEQQQQQQEEHALLGPCLADLGYKRVYVARANVLATINVWEKQRVYRHDRAKAMAADKAKTLHLGMPGVIGLHEDLDGNLSILDGQHRVGMMTLLAEKQEKLMAKQQHENGNESGSITPTNTTIDLDAILVEVYPQPPLPSLDDDTTNTNDDDSRETDKAALQHATDLFVEINKAEPIKLVDMPGVAKPAIRKMLTTAVAQLQDQYSEMFKPSQRCRAPHWNADNLRDALFQSNALERHDLTTSKVLVAWLRDQNETLGQKYQLQGDEKDDADVAKRTKVSAKALTKARQYQFYLGLESTWLSN